MRLNNVARLAAAAIMLASPVAVHAAERAPAPVSDNEQLFGSSVLTILIVAALLGVLIWQVSDSDDEPASP